MIDNHIPTPIVIRIRKAKSERAKNEAKKEEIKERLGNHYLPALKEYYRSLRDIAKAEKLRLFKQKRRAKK